MEFTDHPHLPTPPSHPRALPHTHMLSQLPYLRCWLPPWNNDSRNYVVLRGPHISDALLHNLVLDNCGWGWKGHFLDNSKKKKKKERSQLENLLGSGRHKFYVSFFFSPEIPYKGRLRSLGCCCTGHFFLFTAFSTSCFNYWFPLHCNLELL